MSAKWRNFCIMSSKFIFIITFVFQFLIYNLNICQYLYFNMLQDINQNAYLLRKSPLFRIIISSYWFFIVTFIFKFLICDFERYTAWHYLYFKILIYESQNADMSEKWHHFVIIMSLYWFFIVRFVFQFQICDLKKTHANIFNSKFYYI